MPTALYAPTEDDIASVSSQGAKVDIHELYQPTEDDIASVAPKSAPVTSRGSLGDLMSRENMIKNTMSVGTGNPAFNGIPGTPIHTDAQNYGNVVSRPVVGEGKNAYTVATFEGNPTPHFYDYQGQPIPNTDPRVQKYLDAQPGSTSARDIGVGVKEGFQEALHSLNKGVKKVADDILPMPGPRLVAMGKKNPTIGHIVKTAQGVPAGLGNLAEGIPTFIGQGMETAASIPFALEGNREAQDEMIATGHGLVNAAGFGRGDNGELQGPLYKAVVQGRTGEGASQIGQKFEEDLPMALLTLGGGVHALRGSAIEAGKQAVDIYEGKARAAEAEAASAPSPELENQLHDQAEVYRQKANGIRQRLPASARFAKKQARPLTVTPVEAPAEPGSVAEAVNTAQEQIKASEAPTPERTPLLGDRPDNLTLDELRAQYPVPIPSDPVTDSHAALANLERDVAEGKSKLSAAGKAVDDYQKAREAGEPLPNARPPWGTPEPPVVPLTPDEPVVTPTSTRRDVQRAVQEHFGYTDEQTDAAMALTDNFARNSGRPYDEWYREYVAGIGKGDPVSEARPGIAVEAPKAVNAAASTPEPAPVLTEPAPADYQRTPFQKKGIPGPPKRVEAVAEPVKAAGPKTGEPYTFDYARNPNSGAKDVKGNRFGQDIEPKGKYVVESKTPPEGWESGKKSFQNPLVMDFGGEYGTSTNWKSELSSRYGGKKGLALSRAIKADGHDGIVTTDKYGTSEIVDLSDIQPTRKPPAPPKTKVVEAEPKTLNQAGEPDIESVLQEKYPDVDFNISKGRDGSLSLGKVVVPKVNRGNGVGSAFMRDLIDHADKTGTTIRLSPSTDFGGSSVPRLKQFYKRFGFVENAGKYKDFSTRETMYRNPAEPETLNQRQGTNRGSVEFNNQDASAIVRALKDPNASTLPHEFAHIFRRAAYRDKMLTPEEFETVEKWVGIRDADGNRVGSWGDMEDGVAHREEKWSRGLERFLADGTAPSEALRSVFQKFVAWMKDIYAKTQPDYAGTPLDVELTPEIRKVFDKLLGGEHAPLETVGEARTREASAKASLQAMDESLKPKAETPKVEEAEADKKPAPTYIGSMNEGKFPPEVHDAMKKIVDENGLEDKPTASFPLVNQLAKSLNLSFEGLKNWKPGKFPETPDEMAEGIWRPVWQRAVTNLNMRALFNMKTAEGVLKDAQEAQAEEPTAANAEAVQAAQREYDDAKATATNTTIHDDTLRNASGTGLGNYRVAPSSVDSGTGFKGLANHAEALTNIVSEGKEAEDLLASAEKMSGEGPKVPNVPRPKGKPSRGRTVTAEAAAKLRDEWKAQGPTRLNQSDAPKNPQTETTEFRNWFGSSKVVDADGKPLVVYHGTNGEPFDTFDASRSKKGPSKVGFWFTDSSDLAQVFGDTPIQTHLRIEKPYEITSTQWDRIREAHGGDAQWFADWRDKLINQGYDGVHVKGQTETFEGRRGTSTVKTPDAFSVFDNKQIKSAIGNRGTFDPNDANILHQAAPDPLEGIGVFHYEEGNKTFESWRGAMEKFLGEKLPDNKAKYVYSQVLGLKARAGKTASAAALKTAEPLFKDHIADLGRKGNAKFLRDLPEDLRNKVLEGRPIEDFTPAERQTVARHYDANRVKPKDDPNAKSSFKAQSTVKQIVAEASRLKNAPGRSERMKALNAKRTVGPPKPIDPVVRTLRVSLRGNYDAFTKELEAQYPGIVERLKAGDGTKEYYAAAGEAAVKHSPDKNTPTPTEAQVKVREALRAARDNATGKATPKDEDLTGYNLIDDGQPEPAKYGAFDTIVGRRVEGGPEAAGKIRADLLRDDVGRSAVQKLISDPANLTKEEGRRLARAIDAEAKIGKRSDPNEVTLRLTKLMRDARAGRLDLVTGKDLVRKHLSEKYTKDLTGGKLSKAEVTAKVTKMMEPVNADLDKLKDNDWHGMAEVVNKHDTQGMERFVNNMGAYYRGNLLSNTASLPAIIASHALSNAWEKAVIDPIVAQWDKVEAARTGRERVITSDYRDVKGSMKAIPEGARQAWSVLKSGENAHALNADMSIPHRQLHGEFNVGLDKVADKIKNPVAAKAVRAAGKIVNTPWRFWNRQHGAAFQIVGVPIYDNALRDAARLKATNEGLKGADLDTATKKYYENPTPEMEESAGNNYKEKMFSNPNKWAEFVKQLDHLGPFGRLLQSTLQPFSGIPSNLAGRAIESSTPVGVIKGLSQLAHYGDKITPEQRLNAMRSIVRSIGGMTAAAVAYNWWNSLHPIDEQKHHYSPMVDMFDKRVEVGRLAPIMNAPAVGSLLRERGVKKGILSKDFLESVAGEGPYMGLISQIESIFPEVQNNEKADRTLTKAEKAGAQLLSGWLPGSAAMNAVAAQFDPSGMMRRADNAGDIIARHIPSIPGVPNRIRGQAISRTGLKIMHEHAKGKDVYGNKIQGKSVPEAGGIKLLRYTNAPPRKMP